MELNESQKLAVTHDLGPMMVLAGPGSGKTMVITHRISWLIEEAGADPAGILVVTFTKAAADEMRQRFNFLAKEALPVNFGTFHAIFFSVLKHAYHYTYSNIIKEEQKQRIMCDIIGNMPFETDSIGELAKEILSEIGIVKGRGSDIEDYRSLSCDPSAFREIYRRYNLQLSNRRLIDFEDMMVCTYDLFKERPEYLAAWQQKFRYILIDEFQDINLMQYRIMQMLALPQNNIFIVGDDDQSIYGFRGSDPGIMLNFEHDYPDVIKVYLSVNYRCQASITKAAGRVIRHNKERFDKNIQAHLPAGAPVDIRAFQSPADENNMIIRQIMQYHEQQIPYSEIAVLFRTNTQARMLAEKMTEYNLPFKMQDLVPDLFGHWISRDIISYMMIAKGSGARSDFLRIINRPERYVSREAFTGIHTDIEDLIRFYRDKGQIRKLLLKLRYDLNLISGMEPFAAVNYIRYGIGYDDFLAKYAAKRRLDYSELSDILNEVRDSSADYRDTDSWMEHIRDHTARLREQISKREDENTDAVSFSTMHHSKGLEYRAVFIADANEGVTPHRKAVLDSDVEEERRMFYVAMTRAKEYLHIYFLKERYGRPVTMSRFVGEIIDNGI